MKKTNQFRIVPRSDGTFDIERKYVERKFPSCYEEETWDGVNTVISPEVAKKYIDYLLAVEEEKNRRLSRKVEYYP